MDCKYQDYGPRIDPLANVQCYDRKVYENYLQRKKTTATFSATDIYYSYKDAIVNIETTTTTTSLTNPEFVNKGVGFFIGPCTIVTAASLLIYNNAGQSKRIPDPPNNILATRVDKIKIRVQNVNGDGESYFYEGKILGFSPSFNIGVVQINNVQKQACAAPPIRISPILQWGCSRNTVIGEDVIIISNSYDNPSISISKGIISDNLYSKSNFTNPGFDTQSSSNNTNNSNIMSDETNNIDVEGLLVDAAILEGNIGGPLLDMHGKVIGVITEKIFEGSGSKVFTYAVSEHIARRIVAALQCEKKDKLGGHVKYVEDLLGTYKTYSFGWMGLNSFSAFGPDILRIVPDSKYVKQKGFIVKSVDISGPLIYVFNNIYNFSETGSVSDMNELYLITQMNGANVGVGMGQIPFSSITFMEIPNMEIVLNYRLGSEKFNCPHQVRIQLGTFPIQGDVPPPFAWTRSLPASRGALLKANEEINRGINFTLIFDKFKQHLTSESFLHFFLNLLKKMIFPELHESALPNEMLNVLDEEEIIREASSRGIPDDIMFSVLKAVSNKQFLQFLISKLEEFLKFKFTESS